MPIFAALLPIVNGWLERLFPDPAERQKQLQSLIDAAQAADAAQVEVNKIEAANSSLFVSGWRPFIGWVCGAAFAYQFVVAPLGLWIGFVVGHPIPAPPKLDDTLWQLVFAMLGMGGLRTFEKLRGVAANH